MNEVLFHQKHSLTFLSQKSRVPGFVKLVKDFFLPQKSFITLEDNTIFKGISFGSENSVSGEVVFNTGMVGYTETLTDPSYTGQILVLTYPLIGNYGVPALTRDEFGLPISFESEKIHISGLIVSDYSAKYSHPSAVRSLGDWLKSENIPALSEVDTRALTKKLRSKGSMLGKLEFDSQPIDFYDPNTTDLGALVSCKEITEYYCEDRDNAPTIVLIDSGCKVNIIRSVLQRGMNVIRVPYDYYFMNLDFDGILISNGPGDPKMYKTTVKNVERSLAVGKPIFGICLGHQILAQAIGAETYKLKFGHRSHNQPCLELTNSSNGHAPDYRKCVITSQNHGYAVREEGLPSDWEIWFKNGNDNTVEGIRHKSKPFSSVQFHPEATPGPVDTARLFDNFVQQVKKSESRQFQF